MDDPAHPQLSEQYFYATWNSKYLANYQVIIWKQKITDLKDTPDAEKTYDFEARYLIEDVRPNFFDADQTTEFIDGHYTSMNYEGFTCNTNQTKIVNGVGTNERKVNSDGSTIVNVYYDRVNMKVTFYYKSSDLSGSSYETVGQDIYVKTDSNGRKPQYGKVNGEYVLLTPQENAEATYIYPYQYAPSNNTDATMFGIIDTADGKQEYVKLERKEIYSWHKSGYLYTPTTITTSNSTSTSSPTRSQYVTYNGGFSTIYSIRTKIYYNNKVYYRTRSSSGGSYTFSNPITQAYLRSSISGSENYTGDRYVISGYQFNQTTSNDGTQYGKEGDSYFTLSKTIQGYEYYYNGEKYTGQRYTRTKDSTVYTSDVYAKDNSGNMIAEPDVYYGGTIYGLRDGKYEELTKTLDITYTWYNGENEYTEQRYLKFTRTNDSTFPYMVEWEGLYNQKVSQYHYSFPEQFTWNESRDGNGTGQTLLDSFNIKKNNALVTDYKLYSKGAAPAGVLYHLRQKLDGTYSYQETAHFDIAQVSKSTGLGFYFTNKFHGFEVCGYSTEFYSPSSRKNVG